MNVYWLMVSLVAALDPVVCRKPIHKRAIGTMPKCGNDLTKKGLLCYKKGQKGLKQPHKMMDCGPDKVYQAGLCYEKCPDGYKPLIKNCYKVCSGKYSVDCGLMCAKNALGCASSITLITSGVALAAGVTAWSAPISGAGAAAIAAAKVVAKKGQWKSIFGLMNGSTQSQIGAAAGKAFQKGAIQGVGTGAAAGVLPMLPGLPYNKCE